MIVLAATNQTVFSLVPEDGLREFRRRGPGAPWLAAEWCWASGPHHDDVELNRDGDGRLRTVAIERWAILTASRTAGIRCT